MIARVSKMPLRSGNGYDYGGEWVVTVDGITMLVGSGPHAEKVAKAIEHLVNQTEAKKVE